MADDGQEIGSGYRWTTQQKTWCTEKLILLSSPILVQRAYNAHFKTRKAPGRKTLIRWFRGTGSLDNQERPARDGTPHSGRPRVRSEEVIAAVLHSVEMSPKRSLRHRSQSLGLSKQGRAQGGGGGGGGGAMEAVAAPFLKC